MHTYFSSEVERAIIEKETKAEDSKRPLIETFYNPAYYDPFPSQNETIMVKHRETGIFLERIFKFFEF